MYYEQSTNQFLEHLELPPDYRVDGVICCGTIYEEKFLGVLSDTLKNMKITAKPTNLAHNFLRYVYEIDVDDKRLWFMTGYGGAMLSEYLHWACQFGSRKNILIGSCGGLKKGMQPTDFLVPTSSYGQESSVRMYNRQSPNQPANRTLADSLVNRLKGTDVKIWQGPIITCQAMMAETWDDIQNWSREGYFGVEMESSTLFAVSNHFNVPSAATLFVGDNLIEQHTNLSKSYAEQTHIRRARRLSQFKATLEELLTS